ncbi:hypothetical protein [Mucilaginibacter flavus]|uniref:hypothetical protein n=1 Tax=Mucilaginibacter flavus TaxID=931504 RepID=UPI0025B61DF5|nr:hypothetical protein [Mucilaginibacter flavus]MDN3581244.1 hypothetical protein [Mucilaginibacter flavus]
MDKPNTGQFSSKHIADEYARLLDDVSDIDNLLKDFKALLKKTVEYKADYTMEGLKYVELLLIHLKPSFEEDNDLLLEAAYYIGETVKRTFNGSWSISDDKENFPDGYGQPIITGYSAYGDFYPFMEMENFIANPSIGYFKKVIK